MKKIIFITLFLFIFGQFGFSQKLELKFASLAPKSSSWGVAISKIRKDVYLKTNKQVRITVYWGGQMGDEAEMIKKIKINQIDGCALTGNGLGIVSSETRVLELPQLFKDKRQVDAGYAKAEPLLRQYLREKGFELISLSETGNAYFFSKQKINSFKDISNSKMWLWKGDKFVSIVFNVFGIRTTPISFTEVIPSLQTGLINGFYATPTAAISLQWANQIKYFLNFPIANVSGGIIFSTKAWNKLNKDQQKILSDATRTAVVALTKKNRENDKRSIGIFKNNGIIVDSTFNEKLNRSDLHQKILNRLKKLSGVNSNHVDALYKAIQSN